MNYLTAWYEDIRHFKWKRVLHDHPAFRHLDAMLTELQGFFPSADFEAGARINRHNWLLHLFADNQPNSVYLLNEVAELIRYYRILGSPESYHLFNISGDVDYSALQERLFELQIHYVMAKLELQPVTGQSYFKASGAEKPMDIVVSVEGQNYNVEVTKYYDPFKEELLSLATGIIGRIASRTVKGALFMDEVFAGYLAFKKRDERLIRKSNQVFSKGMQTYIHGYRAAAKSGKIFLPAKTVTDDLEFLIEPSFIERKDDYYESGLTGYPGYIQFQVSANLQSNRSAINLRVMATESVADRNKRLQEKIHKKLLQHRESPYPLLIVIAIEQVFSSHSKNRSQPIASDDVNPDQIETQIKNKAVVLLIFKELLAEGLSYRFQVFGNREIHLPLIQKLKNLQPVLYYKGTDFTKK